MKTDPPHAVHAQDNTLDHRPRDIARLTRLGERRTDSGLNSTARLSRTTHYPDRRRYLSISRVSRRPQADLSRPRVNEDDLGVAQACVRLRTARPPRRRRPGPARRQSCPRGFCRSGIKGQCFLLYQHHRQRCGRADRSSAATGSSRIGGHAANMILRTQFNSRETEPCYRKLRRIAARLDLIRHTRHRGGFARVRVRRNDRYPRRMRDGLGRKTFLNGSKRRTAMHSPGALRKISGQRANSLEPSKKAESFDIRIVTELPAAKIGPTRMKHYESLALPSRTLMR